MLGETSIGELSFQKISIRAFPWSGPARPGPLSLGLGPVRAKVRTVTIVQIRLSIFQDDRSQLESEKMLEFYCCRIAKAYSVFNKIRDEDFERYLNLTNNHNILLWLVAPEFKYSEVANNKIV